MDDDVDQEIDAIKIVLKALGPLDESIQRSVLSYVMRRLGIATEATSTPVKDLADPSNALTAPAPQLHIKTFKEQKQPKSANEMAAVVAYYLASVVPAKDRQLTVSAKDIETQFKIAGFPLPQKLRMTLPNAKAAGYFDTSGNGEYKLNSVGYNLVAHILPRKKANSGND